MDTANFTIFDNYIIINNITEIKEFSENLFLVKVKDIPYEILGENLLLKEVSNDNRTIKITGNCYQVAKKDKQTKKTKGFLKRLFA